MCIIGLQVTEVSFKNCVRVTKCITKIDGATTDHVEDLDLVIPMYNLIEYSSNYSETTGFIQKLKQLLLMQILLMLIVLNLVNLSLNY